MWVNADQVERLVRAAEGAVAQIKRMNDLHERSLAITEQSIRDTQAQLVRMGISNAGGPES